MQSTAVDVGSYLAQVPDSRRPALTKLRKLCLRCLERYSAADAGSSWDASAGVDTAGDTNAGGFSDFGGGGDFSGGSTGGDFSAGGQ